MADRFDIQRFPTGFPDLLGMRVTGETPHQLAQQILSVIETSDYYLWDRVQFAAGQSPVAIGAVGWLANSTGPTIVPQGQLWVLYDVSLRIPPIAAATTLNVLLAIQRTGVGTGWIPLTEELRLPASTGGMIGKCFDRPMLLRPGDTWGTYCSGITGVPASQAFTNASYAVLGI